MARRLRLGLVGAAAALLMAACGDDGASSLEIYCRFSGELDDQDNVPTPEQLDRLVDAAPDEVKDDVAAVAAILKETAEEDLDEAFSDPGLSARLERIQRFAAEECDNGSSG